MLESDTYAAVRLAEAVGLLERVTVGREPEVDLGRGRAARDVVFDRLVGRFAGARAAVQVRLVVRDAGPGAGVVVGLEDVSSHRVSGTQRDCKLTIKFQKLSAASIFLKFKYLYWGKTALVAACSDVMSTSVLSSTTSIPQHSTYCDEVGRGIPLLLLQGVERGAELRD